MIDLTHDAHVHSTFSDGKHDIATNVATAVERGLTTIGLVDHVRRDTDWLPGYVDAVARLRRRSPIAVRCGIEAKILDESGSLDLPPFADRVDDIVVADHQVPIGHGCYAPARVRQFVERGEIDPAEIVERLLDATALAAERHDSVLIAHLFSVLPKAGLDESAVSDAAVRALGRRLAAADARVEISERWECPSVRVARLLATEGVELVASTDSHRKDTIGRYQYVAEVADELDEFELVGGMR